MAATASVSTMAKSQLLPSRKILEVVILTSLAMRIPTQEEASALPALSAMPSHLPTVQYNVNQSLKTLIWA